MIDMYDLPTEADLAKAIMEAKKAESKTDDPFDNKTFFEFWTPVTKHRDHVVTNKTGAVSPKCEFTPAETRVDAAWEKFLKDARARDKKGVKPVTHNDTFGSVVLTSYAQDPNPKNLVGSIKALKKTMVKEMNGKVHRKTEELGKNVILKSMAASPSKNSLVGIVKPKAELKAQKVPSAYLQGKTSKPTQEAPVETKVYTSYNDKIKPSGKNFAGYETKDTMPGMKAHSAQIGNKVGSVKKKELSAAGPKVFKGIDGFHK